MQISYKGKTGTAMAVPAVVALTVLSDTVCVQYGTDQLTYVVITMYIDIMLRVQCVVVLNLNFLC